MRRAVAIVFALLCAGLFAALTARPAHAEPPGLVIATPLTATPWSSIPVVEAAPAPERVSYRWQLVLADLGALGATVVASGLEVNQGDEVRGVALGTYLLGAPLIHAANGHGLRAIGSLALRVGLPALGAYVGVHLQGREDCNQCIDTASPVAGLVLGIGLGGLTALIVDYGVLARPQPVKRGWGPVAAPTGGGAIAGVAGNF